MAKGDWRPFNQALFFKTMSLPPRLLVVHTLGGKTVSGSLVCSDEKGVTIANGTTQRQVEFNHGATLTFFQWLDFPTIDISEGNAKLV